MTSLAVRSKSVELAASGAVTEITDRVRTFMVDGEHNAYLVVLGPTGAGRCSCPVRNGCAHIRAAALVMAREER